MIAGNAAVRDVQTEGLEETKKMSISLDAEVQSHIVKVLTENYKYPLASLIREAVSNAWDSHIMSNKKDTPIPVKLYKNETGNYTLEISDTGLGLDEEGFYKYYMKLGESSKRGVKGVLGYYGCGCKASLSYSDSYEVVCRKNFKEIKFLIFKGEEFPEATKIYEKDTTEENGVIIKVNIDRYDWADCKNAIREQLCYFPTVHIQIENDSFNYLEAKIFENDLFSWSEVYPDNKMHINFGGVRYPLDFEILKIPSISIPIGIKLPTDNCVMPFFNRESLQYSKETKDLILSKIKDISNWFVNKYNENWKEYETFQQAYYEIYNNNKIVNIAGKDFCINDLLKYPDVTPLELKIKGISLNTPRFYKDNCNKFLDEYECLVDYSDYKKTWRVKYVKNNHGIQSLMDGVQLIEVNKIPTGKVRKYLLEKYKGKLMFIKKVNTRRLGNIRFPLENSNSLNYTYILDLDKDNKSLWRSLINEWNNVENEFKSKIINETWTEETKTYQEWLIKDKEYQKAHRATYGSSGKHKVLNKQKGEVTIAYCQKSLVRGKKHKFEKTTEKIETLHRKPKVTIYFNEEEKEKAIELYKLVSGKWNVAIVGTREQNKIKNLHNFKTWKEFMDSNLFKRVATSLLFEKLTDRFDDIFDDDGIDVLQTVCKPFEKDVNKLKEYTRKNGKYVKDNDLLESMITVAAENNLYDYSLWDVYQNVKQNIDKYAFVSLLKINTRNSEDVKNVKSLVNQILYHQQKYRGLHQELEITLKQPELENKTEEVLELIET
jgi:hypothetical protein